MHDVVRLSVEDRSTHPFIYDLPNELLHKIVSFVPFDNRVYFEDAEGEFQDKAQILVVMSVSRRLRMIAQEAEFWFKEEFTFHNLLPRDLDEVLCKENPVHWFREMVIAKALLNDDNLVRSLNKKTRWTFRATEVFYIVALTIPQFIRNVRSIALDTFSGVNPLIERLILCDYITDLCIACVEPINLDAISSSCPRLKHLQLENAGGGLFGSLKTQENLESLCLDSCNNFFDKSFIPQRSRLTLKKLTLSCFDAISIPAMDALSKFYRLEHLALMKVPVDCSIMIARLRAKLSSVELWIDVRVTPLPELSVMLSAPGLRYVTSAKIDIDGTYVEREVYKEHCSSAVENVTLSLLRVQNLTLGMFIDPSWCQMFPRLTALKSLKVLFYYNDSEWTEEDMQNCGPEIVEGALERVYEAIENTPHILVEWDH